MLKPRRRYSGRFHTSVKIAPIDRKECPIVKRSCKLVLPIPASVGKFVIARVSNLMRFNVTVPYKKTHGNLFYDFMQIDIDLCQLRFVRKRKPWQIRQLNAFSPPAAMQESQADKGVVAVHFTLMPC
jgi:hypothetical protein